MAWLAAGKKERGWEGGALIHGSQAGRQWQQRACCSGLLGMQPSRAAARGTLQHLQLARRAHMPARLTQPTNLAPTNFPPPLLTADALRNLGEVGEQVAAAVEDAVLAVVHQVGGPGEGGVVVGGGVSLGSVGSELRMLCLPSSIRWAGLDSSGEGGVGGGASMGVCGGVGGAEQAGLEEVGAAGNATSRHAGT